MRGGHVGSPGGDIVLRETTWSSQASLSVIRCSGTFGEILSGVHGVADLADHLEHGLLATSPRSGVRPGGPTPSMLVG